MMTGPMGRDKQSKTRAGGKDEKENRKTFKNP